MGSGSAYQIVSLVRLSYRWKNQPLPVEPKVLGVVGAASELSVSFPRTAGVRWPLACIASFAEAGPMMGRETHFCISAARLLPSVDNLNAMEYY